MIFVCSHSAFGSKAILKKKNHAAFRRRNTLYRTEIRSTPYRAEISDQSILHMLVMVRFCDFYPLAFSWRNEVYASRIVLKHEIMIMYFTVFILASILTFFYTDTHYWQIRPPYSQNIYFSTYKFLIFLSTILISREYVYFWVCTATSIEKEVKARVIWASRAIAKLLSSNHWIRLDIF